MRVPEKRVRTTRRVFLRGAATAVPAAAVAGAAFAPDAAWAADAKALKPRTLVTLAKVARDIFPHDHVPDRLYASAVAGYDAKAGADAATKALLEEGVARLDADATSRHGKDYLGLNWEADRVPLLRGIEHTPFFKRLRGDLVVSFYDQKAVWPKFGYEGSSAEHGGYLARGFDDIDWLPVA